MRPKISGNLLCFNEIGNIERCIKNFLLYVDELLIIDGGSTDGTIEVIKGIKDKDDRIKLQIIPQGTQKLTRWDRTFDKNGDKAKKWDQSYRRNLLINSSSYDWILEKDTDEDFGDELHDFLSKCDFSASGYKFQWIHVFKNNNANLVVRIDGAWNPKTIKINLYQKKLICYENVLVHPNKIYKDGRKAPWGNMTHVAVPLWHYPFINEQVQGKFILIQNIGFKIPERLVSK